MSTRIERTIAQSCRPLEGELITHGLTASEFYNLTNLVYQVEDLCRLWRLVGPFVRDVDPKTASRVTTHFQSAAVSVSNLRRITERRSHE